VTNHDTNPSNPATTANHHEETPAMTTDEHTILIAFDVEAADRAEAEQYLTRHLPRPGARPGLPPLTPGGPPRMNVRLEAWWVAEDERYDGSDRDSAVFVTKGQQAQASRLLEREMASAAWNLTPHTVTVAEVQEELRPVGWDHNAPDPLWLVCRQCGEAFDDLDPAREHVSPVGCGSYQGFDLLPESEAM
jgi:hypothetical protein